MSPAVLAILATLAVSAIALVGIVFFVANRPKERSETFLLSFAAGVLLATTFLELLPEAVEQSNGESHIFIATLAAMIGFFLLERLLHGFHEHEEIHTAPSRWLILIGDGLHNFIDGVVIAASFAVSPELGFLTTLAVAIHEVPQELADFTILVAGGFTLRQALFLNLASGITAVFGALAFIALEQTVASKIAWFMSTTAGMFIYIAASDLIPQLHHNRSGPSIWIYGPFLGGVAIIAALSVAMGH
jgi:zinc and cadmium transporter